MLDKHQNLKIFQFITLSWLGLIIGSIFAWMMSITTAGQAFEFCLGAGVMHQLIFWRLKKYTLKEK